MTFSQFVFIISMRLIAESMGYRLGRSIFFPVLHHVKAENIPNVIKALENYEKISISLRDEESITTLNSILSVKNRTQNTYGLLGASTVVSEQQVRLTLIYFARHKKFLDFSAQEEGNRLSQYYSLFNPFIRYFSRIKDSYLLCSKEFG